MLMRVSRRNRSLSSVVSWWFIQLFLINWRIFLSRCSPVRVLRVTDQCFSGAGSPSLSLSGQQVHWDTDTRHPGLWLAETGHWRLLIGCIILSDTLPPGHRCVTPNNSVGLCHLHLNKILAVMRVFSVTPTFVWEVADCPIKSKLTQHLEARRRFGCFLFSLTELLVPPATFDQSLWIWAVTRVTRRSMESDKWQNKLTFLSLNCRQTWLGI